MGTREETTAETSRLSRTSHCSIRVIDPTMDHHRRRFLARTAATIGAARLGVWHTIDAAERLPRELAAIARASEWINSPRLTAADLSGKVVLLDFWTYTCINWMRTHPFIRAWAGAYPQALLVIGVHTPEFPFEHDLGNVRRAVQRFGIEYPVVIDNDYAIWHAFKNEYWPALYLVDARGRIRHHQFGEGGYDDSAAAIQQALADAGAEGARARPAGETAAFELPADWANLRSPENYLGTDRAQGFASPGGSDVDHRRNYTMPSRLSLNQWALAGEWTIGRQAITLAAAGGRIAYRFHARDLHLVLAPPTPGRSVRFTVTIDGQPPGAAHGLDTDDAGNGSVGEPRLYQLIRQRQAIADRHFEVQFLDGGVQPYCFTFG